MRKRRFFTGSCVSQWDGEGARRVPLQAADSAVPAGRSAEVTGVGGPVSAHASLVKPPATGAGGGSAEGPAAAPLRLRDPDKKNPSAARPCEPAAFGP